MRHASDRRTCQERGRRFFHTCAARQRNNSSSNDREFLAFTRVNTYLLRAIGWQHQVSWTAMTRLIVSNLCKKTRRCRRGGVPIGELRRVCNELLLAGPWGCLLHLRSAICDTKARRSRPNQAILGQGFTLDPPRADGHRIPVPFNGTRSRGSARRAKTRAGSGGSGQSPGFARR